MKSTNSMNQEMNNQISIDRKIIIKQIIITQIVNRCNVPTAAGRGSGRTTNFEGRCLNLRKTTITKKKHRSIKKLSSDLGFLHNSFEIPIFKRPKTKVLRHSKNATVLEIWLDQGIYTGEKIFSFWIFLLIMELKEWEWSSKWSQEAATEIFLKEKAQLSSLTRFF